MNVAAVLPAGRALTWQEMRAVADLGDPYLAQREVDATRVVRVGSGHISIGGRAFAGRRLRDAGFDAVVLCAEEYQPPGNFFEGLTVVHCPMDDGVLDDETERRACFGASHVVQLVARGAEVLVTCWQGRNRSGLVVALALRSVTGVSGRDARRTLQGRRAGALTNSWFASYLNGLPAPSMSVYAVRA